MQISEKIRTLMFEKGVTQKELASAVGVTEAAMSRYLKGEREPRITVLASLARYFDVPLDYFAEDGSGADTKKTQFPEIRRLVARNANDMTDEQKMELMRILTRK